MSRRGLVWAVITVFMWGSFLILSVYVPQAVRVLGIVIGLLASLICFAAAAYVVASGRWYKDG